MSVYKGYTVKQTLDNNLLLLSVYLTVTFFSSLLLGKFKGTDQSNSFFIEFKSYFISFVLSSGLLSVLFISTNYFAPSRLLIGGTLFLAFLGELLFIFYKKRFKINKEVRVEIKFSIVTFLYLFVILAAVSAYIYFYLKPQHLHRDLLLLGLMLSIWFLSSLFIHQFSDFFTNGKFWRSLYALIKGGVIFISLTAFATFMLIYDFEITLWPFIISVAYAIASMLLFTFVYLSRAQTATDEIRTKLIKATPELESDIVVRIEAQSEKYVSPSQNLYNPYLADQLGSIYLKKFPNLFKFINESVDLYSFDIRQASMIKSSDTYNIEVLPINTFELYLNLHEINDIRRLNRYFIEINQRLVDGGIYIGRLEPNNLRFRRFEQTYPFYFAKFFYFFDFVWKRVFPKLPILQKFYFAITRGKNRALSLAECLGRLHYCGFSLVNLREINNFVYFIVKKDNLPKTDQTPSYGPLIKLKRSGKDGKKISVYKFRTMHPYSEYLQKFVFDIGSLSKGGKFKDDFRITSWGRVFRKLWIDELPMFINFFKGELKIVGVRPLSEHYLSLYPAEFRERRKNYKPGLVPPFYSDMPNTLCEIVESERKYFDAYDKSPILTDVKYFFSAVKNIVFKKARSK